MSSESDVASLQSDHNFDDSANHAEADNDQIIFKYTMGSIGDATTVDDDSDISARLEQNEHDLHLAAELGKVLLQENDELKQTNRQQAEKFSQELEV